MYRTWTLLPFFSGNFVPHMRTYRFLLPVGLFVLALAFGVLAPSPLTTTSESETPSTKPVNAVLGNASFHAVFGRRPSTHTPEQLRLRAHLAYVERILRHTNRPNLTTEQRIRRTALLDTLHTYWNRGRFPRNNEVPGRSPVFIDSDGRLCAVGALIASTAGRSVAETLDENYHLADVRDIDTPIIDTWAQRNGFTRHELAMIQPSYCNIRRCHQYPPTESSPSTEASALEVAGLSTSVGASLLNGALLERSTPSLFGGAVGIAGGTTSLAVGLRGNAKYPTLSSVAGATSVVLGGWAVVSALGESDPVPSSSSGREARSSVHWDVAPAAVSTGDGTIQPGLRTTIAF